MSNPAAWHAAHRKLYEHLKNSTVERPQPKLEDLLPLYQAVAHGCQAGLQKDALSTVYERRIQRGDAHFSWRWLGAYGTELGLFAHFFETRWKQIVPSLDEQGQAWLLIETSFCLRSLGRSEEALEALRLSLSKFVNLKLWDDTVNAAYSLAELELTLGYISTAIPTAQECLEFAALSNSTLSPFLPLSSRSILANALHRAGRIDEAVSGFLSAEEAQIKMVPSVPFLMPPQGFLYCDLLLHPVERRAWARNPRFPPVVETYPRSVYLLNAAKTFRSAPRRIFRCWNHKAPWLSLG